MAGIIYDSSEQLEKVLYELVQQIFKDESNRQKFKEKGVTVKIEVTDPGCSVFLDPAAPDIASRNGDLRADIVLKMEADLMHDFWLGRTNIVEKIAGKRFQVELANNIAAAHLIDFLPLLVSGLDIYPALCEKHGIVM